MKKSFAWLALLLLASVFLFSLSPASCAGNGLPLIVDYAGVLNSSELSPLMTKAESVSSQYACDVAVVFVRGLQGSSSIMQYTDDFFDYNGYGYGAGKDGVMLLVDVQGREYWISTSGFGIDAFTDAGQLYLKDLFVKYLSDGNWAGAADAFISGCDRFLKQARNGQPYDIGNMPKNAFNLYALLGDAGIGFLLGGLPLLKAKKEMETVEPKRDAGDYIRGKAPVLTQRNDTFLGSSVSRVPIPRESDHPHDSGGGGSTIHMSSSGNTHGGSGGHF
jgi:uncharacterized protein